jgi:alpha-tubulin suppressor-like RCC1 family protein
MSQHTQKSEKFTT